MLQKIIGIDPGYLQTGLAVIKIENNTIHLVSSQTVDCTKIKSFGERLKKNFLAVEQILKQHQPHLAAVELVFIAKNPKTALRLGHVRGAIITCLYLHKIITYEYSATTIKQAVVGYGHASKQQILFMVDKILDLPKEKISEHELDAIAAAVCCYHNLQSYINSHSL